VSRAKGKLQARRRPARGAGPSGEAEICLRDRGPRTRRRSTQGAMCPRAGREFATWRPPPPPSEAEVRSRAAEDGCLTRRGGYRVVVRTVGFIRVWAAVGLGSALC
jgi:hypothetical protein